MNTKIGIIGIAMAVIMVTALVVPAAADYSGDHQLVTYEHGLLKDGGLIFETVTDGTAYTKLPSDGSVTQTQSISITIPAGAKVKTARLYNYVTWSKSDGGDKYTPGVPAEAVLTFNGVPKTCVHGFSDSQIGIVPNPIFYGDDAVQYWDGKGQGYDPACTKYAKLYDFPSGTFAWDVTDLVTGSGTYTATITNADSSSTANEYFVTFGFGLLVVYEYKKGPVNVEYWITEGCDYIMNRRCYETAESATTSASFAKAHWGAVPKEAELTVVVMAPDKGYWSNWPASKNMNYFNGLTSAYEIGPSVIDPSIPGYPAYPNMRTKTIGSSTLQGMFTYDVTDKLVRMPKDNILYIRDIGDCMTVGNAFLVVEKQIP